MEPTTEKLGKHITYQVIQTGGNTWLDTATTVSMEKLILQYIIKGTYFTVYNSSLDESTDLDERLQLHGQQPLQTSSYLSQNIYVCIYLVYGRLGLIRLSHLANINLNTEQNTACIQETTKFQQDEGQYHGQSNRKNRLIRCRGYLPTCKRAAGSITKRSR